MRSSAMLRAILPCTRADSRIALPNIRSLETLPRRYPLARENGSPSLELRQLLVGPYRVIFGVMDRTVHILRVIHASRDTLPPPQIPDPR